MVPVRMDNQWAISGRAEPCTTTLKAVMPCQEFTYNLSSINSACLIFHTPSEHSAVTLNSRGVCYIWFTLSCLFIFLLFTQTFLSGYCFHVWSPAAIGRMHSDFILCKRQLRLSHPQFQSVLKCTQNSTILGL